MSVFSCSFVCWAVGGISFTSTMQGGSPKLTAEQVIGIPQLVSTMQSGALGELTIVAYLHPVSNILVTNVTASKATTIGVSTWASSSGSAPA